VFAVIFCVFILFFDCKCDCITFWVNSGSTIKKFLIAKSKQNLFEFPSKFLLKSNNSFNFVANSLKSEIDSFFFDSGVLVVMFETTYLLNLKNYTGPPPLKL
jgi:hypothetical protein